MYDTSHSRVSLALCFQVLGSIGTPIRYTEIKVVDAETDAIVPHGSKGTVKVKGPQVMKGYYKVFDSSVTCLNCHLISLCEGG